MKIIFSLFILHFSFFILNCSAQIKFQETIGGAAADDTHYAQQTNDGGYIIVGTTSSFGAGGGDIYLVKTDATGSVQWSKTYGGVDDESGTCVCQATDGGYFVCGFTNTFGLGNPECIYFKTDSSGNLLWAKTIGGAGYDLAFSCQQTTDSGFVVFGWTETYGAGQGDYYLIKTDAAGDTLWTRTYGWSGDEYGLCIHQTMDKGYIMTGTSNSWGAGDFDVYIVKADSAGNFQWSKNYGGTQNDGGTFIRQTSDGGYINVGNTLSFGAGNDDIYLIRMNGNGDTTWTRTYGNTGKDDGNCVKQTADGNFIVAGTFTTGVPSQAYLLKVNGNGDTLWTRCYGGNNADGLASVWQTTDDGYFLDGSTNSFNAGNDDFYFIKTDTSGFSGCHDTTQATIITRPPTVYKSQVPLVMGGGVITIPALIVHSGGTLNQMCLFSSRPVAAFVSSDTEFCYELNPCVNFFDHSAGNPTSWLWIFNGANPDTSTQQNPSNICYLSPGTYPVTLIVTNSAGSDTLTISPMITAGATPPAPCITVVGGDTLISSHAAFYQWYFNGALIAGAIDSFYVSSQTGFYSVQITDSNGCRSISNNPPCSVQGVNELTDLPFKIYPNPAFDELIIENGQELIGNSQLLIYNVLGEEIYTDIMVGRQATINSKPFAAGVYFVRINDGEREWVEKIIILKN